MSGDWTLEITLREKGGSRRYCRAIDLPVTTFGERLASDMSAGFAFVGSSDPFGEVVEVIKKRYIRRKQFISEARRLGEQLADHLADAEGWHGPDRQDKALDTL